jgi:PE family protein
MQPMAHNPSAVGIGSQVVANGARGLAGGDATAAAVTALLPAGADEVSAAAAATFASEGVQALALNTFAQEELARAGAAFIEVAGIYEAVDGANAATLS